MKCRDTKTQHKVIVSEKDQKQRQLKSKQGERESEKERQRMRKMGTLGDRGMWKGRAQRPTDGCAHAITKNTGGSPFTRSYVYTAEHR